MTVHVGIKCAMNAKRVCVCICVCVMGFKMENAKYKTFTEDLGSLNAVLQKSQKP